MYELSEEELEKLGNMFINFYKQKLTEKIYPFGNPNIRGLSNKIASGSLYRSMKSRVVETEDGLMLEMEYNDYLKYVNRGRKPGKMPPVQAILQWVKERKLKKRDKKGRFAKGGQLSLAWAISKNIATYGIRPAGIFDKAYDSLEDVLMNPPAEFRDEYERLYDAIGQDVENFLMRTLNKEIPTR